MKTTSNCIKLLLGLLLVVPASAQFSGHNLLGDFGLKSGSQVPPGFYAGYMMNRYSTNTIKGPGGGMLEGSGDPSLQVYAHIGIANWATEHKFLGANIGGMAAFPVANLAIDFPRLGFGPQTAGYSDTYIQPLNLGWKTSRADFLAGYAFSAPTGRYEEGADNNTGRGFWSHEITFGSTAYLDSAKTWHVAATGFYELHSKREGDDVQVGNILTVEGGAGKTVMQIINVGVAYYAQWKVSRDQIPNLGNLPGPIADVAAQIIDTKHKVYGIGPEFNIFLPTKMDGAAVLSGVSFTVRYFWETGAVNKTEGDGLTLALIYLF